MEQYVNTYDSYAPQYSERYVPTSRMQVMNSVYLPAGDIDLRTGALRPDRQRRCRTQAMRLEKERLDKEEVQLMESVLRESSKGGIRVSVRLMILTIAATLFFCGIYLLTQQGIIVDRQKAVNRLERSISDYRSQNAGLEAQIAEASDSAKVCYAAAQNLNMIPAEAAEAIHLVAVDTRPADRDQASPNDGQVSITAQAAQQEGGSTVQQDTAQPGQTPALEATSVPAVASVVN